MFEDQNQCPACFEQRQPNVPCVCGYSEEQPVSGLPLPPGTSLMREPGQVAYLLGKVLGAGTFGITYLGWDIRRNVRVAIKEYIPREIVGRSGGSAMVRLHTQRDAAAFEAGLTRFVQEADALRQFRHPNIVNVLDFVNSNDTAYLVMPFYVGKTLGQYLDEQKRMDPEAAIRTIISILEGLQHVHDKHLGGRRWMHRDVKPDNIFVRNDGTPMLIDFGAARTEIGAASRSMSRIFTAGYAPYEQIVLGPEHQGPWIDVYATAATLYHVITGEPPADAPRRHLAVQNGKPDPLVRPRDLVPDLPEAVDEAILAGMAIDYQRRPQDAGELQQLLESAKQAVRRKTAILPETPDRPEAMRTSLGSTVSGKPFAPRKVVIGGGLAALLAIAIIGALMFGSGSGGSETGTIAGRETPPAPVGQPVPPVQEPGSPVDKPVAPGEQKVSNDKPVSPVEKPVRPAPPSTPTPTVTNLVVRVEDANGNAIDGADVRVTPGNIAGRERQRGEYVFEGLSPKAYKLTAQRQGYLAGGADVTLLAGPGARETLVLRRPADSKTGTEQVNNPPASPPDATAIVVGIYKKGGPANPGLRYRLLQRLESGRVVDVDPETTFHSGDNVRFVFESNMEGHLYIVQRGSSGNWSVLFPSPLINGGQHVIRPFEAYTVPSADNWFKFDDNPGDESIRVFLSKKPLDSFPGLEQAVAKQQTVADTEVARAVLKSRELKLVQIPANGTQTPGGAQPPGNYGVSTDSATDAITIAIKLIHR